MTSSNSIGAAFDDVSRRLASAGIAAAKLEARLLVGSVLGVDAAAVLGRPETGVSAKDAARLEAFAARRAKREPLAHILKTREFWSLPFHVTKDTLIPRPDSETIVEAALAWARGRQTVTSILDLGCGSGCLLLALLHELPEARGLGVDISAAALKVAAKNARDLGLADRAKFVQGNWHGNLNGGLTKSFDLIVANPPYIPAGDIPGLEPEVSLFEPRLALSGGDDGLESHRAIAPLLKGLLAPSGQAFLEAGEGQAPPVVDVLQKHGLRLIGIKNDLSGIPRCVAVGVAAAAI